MYLTPDPKNRRDDTVQEVQSMLNAIKANYNHNWTYLSVDGIYGPKSASAVKKFQEYRGISSNMSPQGPILGDTTIRYIRESYNTVPQLRAATNNLPEAKIYKEPFWNPKRVEEAFVDLVRTFNSFLTGQMQYISNLRFDNPQGLKAKYYSIVTRLDPELQKLKSELDKAFNSRGRTRVKHNRAAASSRHHLIKELKKFNIIEKIEKYLESKGISGKIEISALKSKPKIQIRGGGILQFLMYKDVIWDLCRINEWGSEKWKADIQKHLSALIDNLIIGVVSTLLAELAVAAGITIIGASVPAGIIIIIVAIVATIIGLLISFFMYKNDFSFGDLAMDAYAEIITPIKI